MIYPNGYIGTYKGTITQKGTKFVNGTVTGKKGVIGTYYPFIVQKPIPTLSQWGIIVLGMIILILGVVGVRNRKVLFG